MTVQRGCVGALLTLRWHGVVGAWHSERDKVDLHLYILQVLGCGRPGCGRVAGPGQDRSTQADGEGLRRKTLEWMGESS